MLPLVFGQYVNALSKARAVDPKRSRAGLVARVYPKNPRWSARSVSIVMRRTFGRGERLGGGLGDGPGALWQPPPRSRSTGRSPRPLTLLLPRSRSAERRLPRGRGGP